MTESAFRDRVARSEQEFHAGHAVPLLLFSRQNRTLLGGLTIGHIRRGAAQSCMIGYWMGEPHAGKGHMSAAVGLVVPYIFSVLRLHRIEAAVFRKMHGVSGSLKRPGLSRKATFGNT